jgi:hypothetical protein
MNTVQDADMEAKHFLLPGDICRFGLGKVCISPKLKPHEELARRATGCQT